MIIKYFAWLKNITNKDQEIVREKSIKDIKTLKIYLEKKYPKLKKHIKQRDMLRFAVNLKYINNNKNLKSNDEIAIFPPVSGG
tara:strand:+ start:2883 stop:3131 length:249 start_codon:yes stop_codon:yes gene_type:complete